jgi:hypothetical protein
MAAYGGMYQPSQIGPQQTNLGLTGPGSISSYMNPYTEAVRTNALADLESARRSAIAQTGERATAARAFGGSRQGVAEALTNQGFAKQAANLGTTLNEQAFNQAVALQQGDIGRRSAAELANQQAGLQGAQLRLGGASQLGNLAAQQQGFRPATSRCNPQHWPATPWHCSIKPWCYSGQFGDVSQHAKF